MTALVILGLRIVNFIIRAMLRWLLLRAFAGIEVLAMVISTFSFRNGIFLVRAPSALASDSGCSYQTSHDDHHHV